MENLESLKNDKWENAFEVCSFWKGETFFWEKAFWALVGSIGIDEFESIINARKLPAPNPIDILSVVAHKVHRKSWPDLVNEK